MTRSTSFTRVCLTTVLLLLISVSIVSAQSSTIPSVTIGPEVGLVGSDTDVRMLFRAYQLSSGPVEVRLQIELTEPQTGLLIIRHGTWDKVTPSCGPDVNDPCYIDAVKMMSAGDEADLTVDYTVVDVEWGTQKIGSYNFFVNDDPLVTNVPLLFSGQGRTFLPTILY